ncbi:MAG TPA: hypothetical protein VI895_06200 [Bdellovibrionota bacterium]|nr:hypothetical protein [Bdellovibrionota bacterium]
MSVGYRPQSEDTSVEIDRKMFELYREMPPWKKLERMGELNAAVRHLANIGILERHPEATEREMFLREAALRLNRATMVEVFGWDPAVKGY